MARRKSIDPERILDAAERVLINRGMYSLTLDMVAAEAGISKGGLTYTFASKETLMLALLDRDVTRFRAKLKSWGKKEDRLSYPELRGFLEVCRNSSALTEKKIGGILAAVQHAPGSLKVMRSYIRWMQSKFPSDTEQDRRARLVFYATQGLFLMQGFGLLTLTATERKLVVEDFVSFLTEPARSSPRQGRSAAEGRRRSARCCAPD
jgi:AcrR family transcriptional regulator